MLDKGTTKEATLYYELDRVRTQIAELERNLQEKPEYGLGEGSSAAAHREVDWALLRRLRRRSGKLEVALTRLSQGSYGICARCGRPIHPDRLATLPSTELCVGCAMETASKQ